MKNEKLWILGLLFSILINGNLIANDIEKYDLFPLPNNLKPNVKFWIQVYSKYTTDQVIIHDSKNLDIIYEVIDLVDSTTTNDKSMSNKWKKIENVKDRFANILTSLASREIVPDALGSKERFVYELFKENKNPEIYSEAAKNIRAQGGLKDRFRDGLIRSGRYHQQIQSVFNKQNLPSELTALPHVESSFNNKAYSKLGAAGLWQFTHGTGRLFLTIDYTVDDRFHPEKATEAAAKLLKENYATLGTWPLAITAYNHGVNGMKRAVRLLGTTDFGIIAEKYSSRQFGFASSNFYAEFLAALHVSKNYKKYFGEITFEEPPKYSIVNIPNFIKISTILKQLNVSIDEISELNPSLRRSVLMSSRRLPKGFELKIPYREDINTEELFVHIPVSEQSDQQLKSTWYQVEKGDNLKKIARQFKTTVEELIALNADIDDSHKIYENQIIRLPGGEVEKTPKTSETKPTVLAEAKQKTEESKVDKKWYQVRPGDNLDMIASRHNLDVMNLMAINNIADKSQIYAGQLIKLFGEKEVELAYTEKPQSIDNVTKPKAKKLIEQTQKNDHWYQVRVGDNLQKIADQHGVLLADLIKINNIENKNQIRVGQTLIIPPAPEIAAAKIEKPVLAERQTTVITPSSLELPTPDLKKVEMKSNSDEPKKGSKIEKPLPLDQTAFSIPDKIYVLPDETLGHIADWLEIPTQKLRELNGLDFNQDIQLGQQIHIIYMNVREEEFHQKRMEYHQSIEEDFFNTYKVVGVQNHKLRRGENIWYLSNEVYEVPYWLLVKYNPNTNFDQLKMGDDLIIPIIVSIEES